MSLFLIPGAKYAQKVHISAALHEAIASSRGDEAAATVTTACRALQELRSAVFDPPYTEANRRELKRYLAALHFVLKEARIPHELPQPLMWVNAFDADGTCAPSDLRVDHLSVLFNLAVCEAHLANTAYRQRRADPNAMRTATLHFQNAAGFFQAAADHPIPGGFRSATVDLYPPTLKALEMAMLGNAQQAFYEIALENGNSPSILARFAVGAREFYAIADESCREPDVVNTSVNAYVGRPAAALAAYFDVVAQWSMVTAARTDHDMRQQLKRIELAQRSLEAGLHTVQVLQNYSALASVSTLRQALETELKGFQREVQDRKESAEKENRTIYFTTPAPASEVPEIQPRQSVRPTDMQNAHSEQEVDPRLLVLKDLPESVSPQLSDLASRYSDMVSKTVKDEIDSLSSAAEALQKQVLHTEATLESRRHLVDAKLSKPTAMSSSSLEEEQKAIDIVLAAQNRGGFTALAELQLQIRNMAAEARSQTQSVETLLQNEEEEDRKLRRRGPVHRRSSTELTQPYWSAVAKLKGNLEVAAKADAKVKADIEFHSKAISQLERVNIRDLTPPSAMAPKTAGSPLAVLIANVSARTDPQVKAANDLFLRKQEIVRELDKMKEGENPYKTTATITGDGPEVERLSAIIDTRYGDIKEKAQVCRGDMESRTGELNEAMSSLELSSLSIDSAEDIQARMNEVYRHQAAAQKFDEVMDHMRQGAEFYTREQDCIVMLRSDVEGFIAARQQEAQDISNQLETQSFGSAGYPNQPGRHELNGNPPSQGGYAYPNAQPQNQTHSDAPGFWRRP